MADKPLDMSSIPEFNIDKTDQPVVEWIKHVKLIYELCKVKKIERFCPLRLRRGPLAVYRQLSKEQKADIGQIKQAFTFDPIVHLCRDYRAMLSDYFERHQEWRT